MKGYKGFYPGLICEPDNEHKKQYAENTVYEEDEAECCRSGMHFCKYPLDVFGYYPPVTDKGVSEYAEVEALDKPVTDDEEKYCSKKLKIGAKIGIPALVQASVEYIKNNIVETKKESARGNYSAATNTGDCSAATNTGNHSAATNTGDRSAATNTGYQSAASVGGKDSIAIAFGLESKAKGSLGCYIVLTEWGEDDEGNRQLKTVKCHKVDGKTVKPDTWYTLKNGKFTEVK